MGTSDKVLHELRAVEASLRRVRGSTRGLGRR